MLNKILNWDKNLKQHSFAPSPLIMTFLAATALLKTSISIGLAFPPLLLHTHHVRRETHNICYYYTNLMMYIIKAVVPKDRSHASYTWRACPRTRLLVRLQSNRQAPDPWRRSSRTATILLSPSSRQSRCPSARTNCRSNPAAVRWRSLSLLKTKKKQWQKSPTAHDIMMKKKCRVSSSFLNDIIYVEVSTDCRTDYGDGQTPGFALDQLFGGRFRHDVSIWHGSQQARFIMAIIFY